MKERAIPRLPAVLLSTVLCGCVLFEEVTPGMEYGFRYDPMHFVENDTSAQGALVRTRVFKKPKEGDAERIRKLIDGMFARQQPDGTFQEPHQEGVPAATGNRLRNLLELGCDPKRPEAQKAARAILKAIESGTDKDREIPTSIYAMESLCLTGHKDHPAVVKTLQWHLDRPNEYLGPFKGCPWSPDVMVKAMWNCRKAADTRAYCETSLRWIADNLNEAGCISYKDPWGFVDCAGFADTPVSRDVVVRMLPVILRGQEPGGGWAHRSLPVFRALVKHGLLKPLRKRPPLPSDWTLVRSIPAPPGNLHALTWDGKRLWVRDRSRNEAVAISPKDGTVLRRVALPERDITGMGWWDDGLVLAVKGPHQALKVDPKTGAVLRELPLGGLHWIGDITQVGGKLCVGDGWMGNVNLFDPAKPEERRGVVLGGPGPNSLAVEGDAVWHSDTWAPAIFKSGIEKHGQLLDWGEKPFAGRCDGLAHDGKQLWALDNRDKRIAVIEKSAETAQSYEWLRGCVTARVDPLFLPAAGEQHIRSRATFRNASVLPATIIVGLMAPALRVTPERVTMRVAGRSEDTVEFEVTPREGHRVPLRPRVYVGWSATFEPKEDQRVTDARSEEIPIRRR